jgi:hypothetical protein
VWAAIHHQFRREPARVEQLAAQVVALATEQGLRFWLAVGAYQLGAAVILHTFNLGALAAAYGQAGKPDELTRRSCFQRDQPFLHVTISSNGLHARDAPVPGSAASSRLRAR